MKATTAKEILTRRMEGDRRRYERLRSNRYEAGYRQTTIWLTVDDLDALDRLKVTLGAGNRSEVISALLKDRQS